MTLDLLACADGTLSPITSAAWAGVVATFLGAGFRIDLPAGERPEAQRHEGARVASLATLLGTSLPADVWTLATQAHPDQPIEIMGGWPRSFREDDAFRIAVRPVRERLEPRTASVLAMAAPPRLTRGLPTISRLADEVALSGIDAEVGIWADGAGAVVTSTAGPVLAQRADGTWSMGSDSATWLACTTAADLGAERNLTVDDLGSARSLAVVRRALGVQALSLVPGP
ncbi:MAG: hypothetical protein NVSMB48_22940 [Marmoricola sp.]